jgi:hypothetical protein
MFYTFISVIFKNKIFIDFEFDEINVGGINNFFCILKMDN